MSRNLGRVDCARCEEKVVLTSGWRVKSDPQPGVNGMTVADAECQTCHARYTAWIKPSPEEYNYGSRQFDLNQVAEYGFYDLSYRSTFNDEAGPDDLPPWTAPTPRRLLTRADAVKATSLYEQLDLVNQKIKNHAKDADAGKIYIGGIFSTEVKVSVEDLETVRKIATKSLTIERDRIIKELTDLGFDPNDDEIPF